MKANRLADEIRAGCHVEADKVEKVIASCFEMINNVNVSDICGEINVQPVEMKLDHIQSKGNGLFLSPIPQSSMSERVKDEKKKRKTNVVCDEFVVVDFVVNEEDLNVIVIVGGDTGVFDELQKTIDTSLETERVRRIHTSLRR